MYKVSVIITTFNRCSALARTLPTVFQQDMAKDCYEVLVVVDGSTDDTEAHLATLRPACAFQVIKQENRGLGHARNTGAGAARGELLLFLDDDIFCEPSLIREHVLAHASTPNRVAIGRNRFHPESPPNLAAGLAEEWDKDWEKPRPPSDTPWDDGFTLDANTSLLRSIFLEIGGYDSRLRARENVEIAFRLWAAGMRPLFIPSAIGHHFYIKTTRGLAADAAFMGAEEVLLCRKHPGYRAHSTLARLLRGSKARRWMVGAAATRPSLALVNGFIAGAERLRFFPPVTKAGKRAIMLRQGASYVYHAIRQTGSRAAFDQEFDRKLPVLLYHSVGSSRVKGHEELVVSPAKFRAQIEYLRRNGYQTILPSAWLNWQQGGQPLPPKPVIITFDDGYADLCDHALPILKENGFTAVVFLSTRLVGKNLPWDGASVMNVEQIRYWKNQGIQFGAHSQTHADLRSLRGPALAAEIDGSFADFENLLGTKPEWFAYPYGRYDAGVVAGASRFKLAFTTEYGLNSLATNPLQMRRTMVQPADSLATFALRLWLGYYPLEQLRIKLGVRTRLRQLIRRRLS